MSGLLIRGGRLVDPGSGVDGLLDVRTHGDIVAAVGPGLEPEAGDRVVEAHGCIVAPGFVDLHAHLREPGFEHKGTIASETLAALHGGFTTLCAMPNTEPAPDRAEVVQALWDRVRTTARVRVFPIGTVTRRRQGKELAELGELAETGCVAFSDDGNPVADPALMRRAMEFAATLGLPLSEHSDDPALSAGGVMHEGVVSERLGLAGQPAAAEISAIARNLALAELTGCRLHTAHVSTARGVELIADAKARGLVVTCEVTPSHLFLTDEVVFGGGPGPAYDTRGKINPPLREERDRQALLKALDAGIIDAIATDHAPHAIQDKLCEFDLAAPGISCFDTAIATLLTQVSRGELRLERVIEALTVRPAQVFGLDKRVPGLGRVLVGGPADVVVLDPTREWLVEAATMHSKGKNTPLIGRRLTGAVRAVVFAGNLTIGEGGGA
ncbi:MAG: dihydroorotase [Dehalococcoidia bacterium]